MKMSTDTLLLWQRNLFQKHPDSPEDILEKFILENISHIFTYHKQKTSLLHLNLATPATKGLNLNREKKTQTTVFVPKDHPRSLLLAHQNPLPLLFVWFLQVVWASSLDTPILHLTVEADGWIGIDFRDGCLNVPGGELCNIVGE